MWKVKKIFQDVDSAIFELVWQWARKRHNNKPRRWIKDKYFHDYEERHWVFSGVVIGRDGVLETVRLFREAPRRENGKQPPGKKAITGSLEESKGTVSSMSPTDHQTDRVAQPPQGVA